MDSRLSVYLDFMRFSAAAVVFLHHFCQPPFLARTIHFPGRTAVIIFFVVSGFVIAYVSDTRETSWRSYAVSRFARIYSVVLPALALTGVLWFLGVKWLGASEYEAYSHPFLRLALSSVFANQVWNLTVQPLNNGPYWSICYEVWYYLLFGLWLFARGPYKHLSIALVALLIGPRILLLAPIWLMGVGAYRIRKEWAPESLAWARGCFAISFTFFVLVAFLWNPMDGLAEGFRDGQLDEDLYLSGLPIFVGGDWRFPSDYLAGLAFALTLIALPRATVRANGLSSFGQAVRQASSFTFSLYLYHVPLLFFWLALLSAVLANTALVSVGTLFATILSVWLLGSVTEKRKTIYTKVFSGILGHSRTNVLGSVK